MEICSITTGDPRFDPASPVKVNGYEFVPVPRADLIIGGVKTYFDPANHPLHVRLRDVSSDLMAVARQNGPDKEVNIENLYVLSGSAAALGIIAAHQLKDLSDRGLLVEAPGRG